MVMEKRAAEARFARRRRAATRARSIAAGEFKARCLELMDRVRDHGLEYVVTKHGEPVAKLVPYSAPSRQTLFGSMHGTYQMINDRQEPFDIEIAPFTLSEPYSTVH